MPPCGTQDDENMMVLWRRSLYWSSSSVAVMAALVVLVIFERRASPYPLHLGRGSLFVPGARFSEQWINFSTLLFDELGTPPVASLKSLACIPPSNHRRRLGRDHSCSCFPGPPERAPPPRFHPRFRGGPAARDRACAAPNRGTYPPRH